jgi:ABC-type branched-subunit amino acid transport system ATPase component
MNIQLAEPPSNDTGPGPAAKRDLLVINDLAISFGGIHALRDVSLTARTREVAGVIGPNGAGKTTLFNCISGLLTPDHGSLTFDGHHLKRMGNPMLRARLGIGRTFQTPRLFRSVSVLDNLLLGCRAANAHGRGYDFDPGLREQSPEQRARRIAGLVGYEGALEAPASSLSFGEMRVVELARSLCASPCLLMLDEPASGLDVGQAQDLVALVRDLADLGLAVLLIEHDMSVVMGVCEDITVLDFGSVIARGAPRQIQENQDVIDAYLGKAH